MDGRKPRNQRLGEDLLLIERGAHAEAELRVVFEERVGPGRSAAGSVLAVGRCGQVAAVDRGAAGRVGDVEPIAEELGQQLDVGRFAATCAGAGELKERLQQLQVLHLRVRKLVAIDFGQRQGRSPSFRARLRASGACGTMLMALWLASLLLFTGQTSTQTAQPVQSSGATCSV